MMRMRGYASMRITRFHPRKKVSWISKAPSSHQTESHHMIINLLHDRRVNKVCMQTQVHTNAHTCICTHKHIILFLERIASSELTIFNSEEAIRSKNKIST